ncbi:MAG: hypothetical protein ACRCTZ_04580, partial [Sarcina sp.]
PILSSSFTYTGNVPSVYGMEKSIVDIEDHNMGMMALTFDTDYRLCEVEWALEDNGILTPMNLLKNMIKNGGDTMAMSRYQQAKILILAGEYNKETLTKQLTRYLEKGDKYLIQAEYDELIALMEARELVVEK